MRHADILFIITRGKISGQGGFDESCRRKDPVAGQVVKTVTSRRSARKANPAKCADGCPGTCRNRRPLDRGIQVLGIFLRLDFGFFFQNPDEVAQDGRIVAFSADEDVNQQSEGAAQLLEAEVG